MPLEIWIPPSAREKQRFLRCELCTKRFPLAQRPQFDRHVKACVRRNGEKLEAHVARRDSDFGLDGFDTELYAHLRKGGS